ncbi:hypothetical protein BDY21DRAFT_329934 [Lineolata rhizophorae]|uniref:Uncharacterized protein n=1 Tax=Lineolata rhizophorae TaxID=578093 RepID=A0A6A6PD42_9PEZI|nr:hypothetical protein BDY21DRAFT_329934 [Lineolata rhizophorae]
MQTTTTFVPRSPPPRSRLSFAPTAKVAKGVLPPKATGTSQDFARVSQARRVCHGFPGCPKEARDKGVRKTLKSTRETSLLQALPIKGTDDARNGREAGRRPGHRPAKKKMLQIRSVLVGRQKHSSLGCAAAVQAGKAKRGKKVAVEARQPDEGPS